MYRKAKNIQIYINRQTGRLATYRQIYRQAGRPAGRQAERKKDRQTDRKTDFEIFFSTILYFFGTVNTVCMYYIHLWY